MTGVKCHTRKVVREGVKNVGRIRIRPLRNFKNGGKMKFILSAGVEWYKYKLPLTLPDFLKQPLSSGHQAEADGEEGPQPHRGGQRGYNGMV